MTKQGLPTPEELAGMLEDTAEDRTRITLTVKETTYVLVTLACYWSLVPGCEDAECPACNEDRRIFWGMSNALPISARVKYQKALRETGVPLPEGPWEDVPIR
jgi:hypothetical protein